MTTRTWSALVPHCPAWGGGVRMEEPFRRPWGVRVTWQKNLDGTTGWGGGLWSLFPSFCGPDLLGQAPSS